jgi:glutamate/tyrosine decarboxylase-like PLP-dependent enzyme
MNRQVIRFPEKGLDSEAMIAELKAHRADDALWRNGRMFGYIYHPGTREAKAIEQAYHLFLNENALNPSLFSSLRHLENETVAMVADLLHAGDGFAGNLTTGGSESILVAVKTERDWARKHKPEILEPEIIAPVTTHPAFSKAADMTGVRAVYAPLTPDRRVDVAEVEKLINKNTIAITASAPCFPYGVIDPIEELAALARKNDLLFHVDSCLGGLMLPFIESLGFEVPPFDFRVTGVTSISADIHKYGYSAKGASVILYRSHELRKFQYFVMSSWPGGLYASPTMLGTRSGAPIAAAWAALRSIAREGYLKMADSVMNTTHEIQKGIESIPGLKVISKPVMSVFSFTSDRHDIYLIGDELSKRGWNLDKLQFPSALHMTVSYDNTGHSGEFLEALKESVSVVEGQKIRAASSHVLASVVRAMSRFLPEKWFRRLSARFTGILNTGNSGGATTGAAAYGMMVAIDNRENVNEIMLDVLDKLYSV